MIIDINQHNIAIGDKYNIHIDNEPSYKASTKLFRVLSELVLLDNSGIDLGYRVQKNWSFLKTSYDIHLPNGNKILYRTISFWKCHYYCIDGDNRYDIYGHRGRKYSVYKNNKQIAWWDKEALTWFEGDNYRITANNDVDKMLIICFCLIVDNSSSNNSDNNAVSIDFGKFGPFAKNFNPNWKPN